MPSKHSKECRGRTMKENSEYKNDTFSQTRPNLRTSIMINVAIYFVEIPRVRKNLIDVGRSRVARNI